jgi:hypothetical protein
VKRQHYTPPRPLHDLLRAVALVACCVAIGWMAAQGLN